MNGKQHRVVVVGGGYVGAIAAARAAGRLRGRGAVTLIAPEEQFVQRLRLHQVGTGQRVAAPALSKLCGRRVSHVRAWAESVSLDEGAVAVRDAGGGAATIPYDSLILATGSTVDTASVPGVALHADTLSDAGSSRRLARKLEHAPDGARIVVVGAGLTGIEAATEIAETRPGARVSIVSREVLGDRFSPRGREHLLGACDRLGIDVLDGVEVAGVAPGALEPAQGAPMPFEVLVWCGGFTPRPLAVTSGLATGPRGGALVDRRMRSVSHPQVLVAGDAAECPPLPNGSAVRMSCQAGMPAGAHAADVVVARVRGRQEPEFDFGYVSWNVSLGRRDGLIQWVDRADRPKGRVTRGRRGAWIKELVTASGAKGPLWEGRLPGALRWLSAGNAAAGGTPLGQSAGDPARRAT